MRSEGQMDVVPYAFLLLLSHRILYYHDLTSFISITSPGRNVVSLFVKTFVSEKIMLMSGRKHVPSERYDFITQNIFSEQ